LVEPGDSAPDFNLPDQAGQQLKLADFADKRLVLCFYPGDFTNVCSDQLALYESLKSDFSDAGAVIVGASVDSSACHGAFAEKLGLTMPLLADFHPKGEVSTAYGAYSPEYGCSSRSIFLVEPDRSVSWVYHSPPLEVPGANLIFDALSA
jgi:peroxiredoxin